MTQSVMSEPVIIVGAGIAGLVCAIELQRAGVPVKVLEQADDVGGRVRSTMQDGFVLDHGFQVLFTAYPTLNRYLDASALAYRPFLPGAMISRNGRAALVGDAWRDPSLLLDTLLASVISLGDKMRLLALRQHARGLSLDDCFTGPHAALSTRAFLQQRGFSEAAISGFFAPFYGGILLDRTLSTSASILLFTFRMLAEGDTVVPAAGIGAISAHLAAQLAPGTVHTTRRVERVLVEGGRASGVVTSDGAVHAASQVVLATEVPATARLAQSVGVSLTLPTESRGCTTLYYTAARTPIPGRALWLNADQNAVVSHAITLTDVAPEYSRSGRPLIAATCLGEKATLDDATLDARAQSELLRLHGAPANETRLERLAIWRVPYAQFAQPPGWWAGRPQATTPCPGLFLAGEMLHSSSLEGAARGAVAAASAVTSARATTAA
jgi:phytoene dehydrogenase-like protein